MRPRTSFGPHGRGARSDTDNGRDGTGCGRLPVHARVDLRLANVKSATGPVPDSGAGRTRESGENPELSRSGKPERQPSHSTGVCPWEAMASRRHTGMPVSPNTCPLCHTESGTAQRKPVDKITVETVKSTEVMLAPCVFPVLPPRPTTVFYLTRIKEHTPCTRFTTASETAPISLPPFPGSHVTGRTMNGPPQSLRTETM